MSNQKVDERVAGDRVGLSAARTRANPVVSTIGSAKLRQLVDHLVIFRPMWADSLHRYFACMEDFNMWSMWNAPSDRDYIDPHGSG